MKFILNIQEAFSNLFSAKLRTALAILGILVGTGSVVAMVSTGELATRAALAEFQKLGTNLLAVSFYDKSHHDTYDNRKFGHLTLNNFNHIAEKSIPGVALIAPYGDIFADVNFKSHSLDSTTIIGSTPSLQSIVKLEIAQGRFITNFDRNARYAVIGANIHKKIQSFGIDNPIGFHIILNKEIFTIIGITRPWKESAFFNENLDNSIIIPITVAKNVSPYFRINNAIIRLQETAIVNTVQQKINMYFDKYVPNKGVSFKSPQQIIDSMKKQRQTLTLLLALIGSISLIVGGIGVMNIMLVSVTERRKEIGIRMAIGAKRRDIQWLFLTESIALTLFGGIMGILLGIGIAFAIAFFAHWEFVIFWIPPLVGFMVSVCTGIFFGFYPAYQASRLDPIQTLRS